MSSAYIENVIRWLEVRDREFWTCGRCQHGIVEAYEGEERWPSIRDLAQLPHTYPSAFQWLEATPLMAALRTELARRESSRRPWAAYVEGIRRGVELLLRRHASWHQRRSYRRSHR
jgi:hypothetical protein